ncbi:MAG: hypothetical protein H7246_01645 [Phycisphaerae bacterium]|nr:hypothetical protein [Saprospiraceae bacterium]
MKKSITSIFSFAISFFALALSFGCQKEFEPLDNSLHLMQATSTERDICNPCTRTFSATANVGGTIALSWQFETGNYTYSIQVYDINLSQQFASFSTTLSGATISNAVSGHTYLITVGNGVGTPLQQEVIVP